MSKLTFDRLSYKYIYILKLSNIFNGLQIYSDYNYIYLNEIAQNNRKINVCPPNTATAQKILQCQKIHWQSRVISHRCLRNVILVLVEEIIRDFLFVFLLTEHLLAGDFIFIATRVRRQSVCSKCLFLLATVLLIVLIAFIFATAVSKYVCSRNIQNRSKGSRDVLINRLKSALADYRPFCRLSVSAD